MRTTLYVVLCLLLQCTVEAQNECIGFIKAGNLTVRCGTETHQITRDGKTNAFAVDPSGTKVLLERRKGIDRVAELFSIPSGNLLRRDSSAVEYVESCGTIVARDNTRSPGYLTRDLITSREFSISPYADFRCSADRKVVIGLVGTSPARLELGAPPTTEIASARMPNLIQFAISSAGKYVAYATAEMVLCRFSVPDKSSSCSPIPQFALGGLSVSDDGTVLYSVSNDACAYEDRVRAAQHDCDELYSWTLASAKPLLQSTGGRPQWITKSQADALTAAAPALKL